MRVQARSVVVVGLAGMVAIAAACGEESSSPTDPTLPDASGTFDGGMPPEGVDGATPRDGATATDAPVTGEDAMPMDAGPADTGVDAGPTGCAAAGSDTSWAQVVAYIPCTTTITDVTGKSTIEIFNTPTVSAQPAGAPGGASCALGNAGAFNTANGFGVTLPTKLGTADYTIELAVYQTGWYEPTDQQSEVLIGSSAYPPSPGGFPSFFSHSGTDALQFIGGANASSYTDPTSALNTWQSYAASRVAGTTYLFRNGTLLTSFADTTDYTDTVFYVGHQVNGSFNAVLGSVGQVRITAAGRYTTSYGACAGGFATK